MTNTLHRVGEPASFRDDFVIFAIPARGINHQGAAEKLRAFLELALKHGPINLRGLYGPAQDLTPLVHWRRNEVLDPQAVARSAGGETSAVAVFDDPARLEAFLRDVRAADLGLSVNISGLADATRCLCRKAGITRHSLNYSLGFHGDHTRLPDRPVLELSSMCGHGMIAHNLARKMLDWVKEGRRTPAQAAACMARFCSCGIFNLTRAIRILERARVGLSGEGA